MLTFAKTHVYPTLKLYSGICKDEIESPLQVGVHTSIVYLNCTTYIGVRCGVVWCGVTPRIDTKRA